MATKITRRGLLAGIGSGIVGAAAGIVSFKHFSWGGRDFTRAGYPPPPPVVPPGKTYWANWSGIHSATPLQIASVTDEQDLRRALTAPATAQAKVRPVGSSHSFSALVPTDGILIDVSRINGLTSIVEIPPATRTADGATAIATFGAGTRLSQAARELDDKGYAFPNLPDIDVQTLAGTFATATHGTGAGLTALHDYVESMRIVTATGEALQLSRTANSDLFAAALVSLGALGIITEYSLRVVPAFALRRRVWAEPLRDLLPRAAAMASEHRNFEFYYFPGTGYAAAITHDLHEGAVSGRGAGEDENILTDLKDLRDMLGWAPWLRRRLLASSIPKGTVEDFTDHSWRLLSTARPTKFNEMEYEIPLARGLETFDRISRIMDRQRDTYFPMEVRFIAADRTAWLSPFNDGPRLAISIHAALDERYAFFFRDLEPVFRAAAGRPHWGKLHSLKFAELRELYPRLTDFARIRRELDPNERLLNAHLETLFKANYTS